MSETPKPVIVTQPDKGAKIAVKPQDVPTKTESPATSPVEPAHQPTTQDAIPSTPEAVLAAAENPSATNPNATPDPLAVKTSSAESGASKNAKNVAFAALGILAA